MSLFSRLGEGITKEKVTDPARLFRALPNREERFVAPRDIQTEVWSKWHARRTEQDLILKMNTGSGKTVVGLVILLSSLNEGVGPAVYLVPDKQLQDQVIKTAGALGIRVTTEVGDPGFRRSESILVVTMTKLINGRSQFGVRGGTNQRRVPIGSIVIDDAHASIPIAEGQFAVTIKREDETYNKLFSLFSDDIKSQSLSDWTSIKSGEGSAVVAVPYWAWHDKLESAAQILAAQANDQDNQFSWPLINGHLEICDIAITPGEIEIALPAPYLQAIPSFAEARRRIYMTATLADDSVVASKLGADPITVVKPIAPEFASDLGDRLILTPIETSQAVKRTEILLLASKLAVEHNVVVLVPSRYRSNDWSPYTKEIHDKTTISDCIARLSTGHVGLVVLIAKYDGVDLPNNSCRVLIIDGLPERYSPLERIEAGALGDADAIRTNQIQRIEQGMGRGVRSATDYAAVILLDPRLVERLYNSADLAVLSPGTRAQLKLSQTLADQSLRGKGIAVVETAIRDFLNRDPAWTKVAKEAIDAIPYPESTPVEAHVIAERTAFELALQGRYLDAAEAILRDVETIQDSWLRGWHKQRAASYLNRVDPNRAREIQRRALIDNNFILRPPMQIPVQRITLARQQSNMSMTHIADTYPDARTFEIKIDALLANLTPAPVQGSYKQFEAAMKELGLLFGFASARPDHTTRVGPDNLWAIGGDRYLVIECKSEATTDRISRDDLEQLTHSMDWFGAAYNEARYIGTPIIIHPSRQPYFDAVPRQGTRVLTFEKLEGLRQAVRGYAQAISQNSWPPLEETVKLALTQFKLLGSQFIESWTQDPQS